MANRRRSSWKATLSSSVPVPNLPRMGLMAPVAKEDDMVDAFAIVDFLKNSSVVLSANDLLRPVAVITTQSDKFAHWILFTTESNAFPVEKRDGSLLSIHGSSYAFSVVKGHPPNVIYEYKLPDYNDARIDDINFAAARAVATLLKERMDGNETMNFFTDKVASRLKYFTRVRLGVTLEDAMPTHTPVAHPTPCSPDEREHFEPFVKPTFQNLDDLLWAFATHTVEGKRNTQTTVAGDWKSTMSGPESFQPLVFCHALARA